METDTPSAEPVAAEAPLTPPPAPTQAAAEAEPVQAAEPEAVPAEQPAAPEPVAAHLLNVKVEVSSPQKDQIKACVLQALEMGIALEAWGSGAAVDAGLDGIADGTTTDILSLIS